MLEIQTIASGSAGNCYIITSGKSKIMIECGITAREIRKTIGFKLSEVLACLVSHEHKDHCKAVKDITKAGIDVYMSPGTAEEIGIESHRIRPCFPMNPFRVGPFTVLPFDVQHDAKQPLGFLIQSGSDKLVFVTDSYYCRYRFKGLTHIMIECNYSLGILEQNIADGLVPGAIRSRIIRSHFELENVKDFLSANDLSAVEEIHLIHISSGNGDPDRFRREIQESTGKPTYTPGGNV
jgi:phosphoribosyl 1,2-cyclic phosphodiesterase